jgi:ribonuclease HII
MNLWQFEEELYNEGYKCIGGVDEAGRGPLFGPVVAACAYLPKGFHLEGLNDSKQLSEKKREAFYEYLIKNIHYGIGIVSAEEIDKINIYEASRKAMMLAIKDISSKIKLDYILSDAMPLNLDIPCKAIIKGDSLSYSIAAASVIAKVTRDKMLMEFDKKYPMYGFAKHKGYPTKYHIEMLNKYGLIDGYRLTYKPVREVLKNAEFSK